MRQALKIHPDSTCQAVLGIEADVSCRPDGALTLSYMVSGTIGDLSLPPVSDPARTDGLWQRMCFEVFIRLPTQPEYYEFNFAPSTQWAAYRFSSYREGMEYANDIAVPRIEAIARADAYRLETTLKLKLARPWRLALSAVIEETNQRKSYWALAHPPGKPDFHHPDGFALELLQCESP